MRNVVLVGFMGTGKTVVAKSLAKKLSMKYVSTDNLIEEKEKMSIRDIFSKKGEAYFRKTETEVVKRVSSMEGVVVDAGGGVVIDERNIELFKKKGTLVCLWAEADTILKRTKRFAHRPLLEVRNPRVKITELLASRKTFYERADHHIMTSGMSVEDVVKETERIVKNA